MAKDSAPQRNTKTPKSKPARDIVPRPISFLADEPPPPPPGQRAREAAFDDVVRSVGGRPPAGLHDATVTQALACMVGRLEDDPVINALEAMRDELYMLHAVVFEKGGREYFSNEQLSDMLARLSQRAEACAHLHWHMLHRALDHVERAAEAAE